MYIYLYPMFLDKKTGPEKLGKLVQSHTTSKVVPPGQDLKPERLTPKYKNVTTLLHCIIIW